MIPESQTTPGLIKKKKKEPSGTRTWGLCRFVDGISATRNGFYHIVVGEKLSLV